MNFKVKNVDNEQVRNKYAKMIQQGKATQPTPFPPLNRADHQGSRIIQRFGCRMRLLTAGFSGSLLQPLST